MGIDAAGKVNGQVQVTLYAESGQAVRSRKGAPEVVQIDRATLEALIARPAPVDMQLAPPQVRAAASVDDPIALYGDKLMQLAEAGRLWVRRGNGMARATAAECAERLDAGKTVFIVTETSRRSRSDSRYHDNGSHKDSWSGGSGDFSSGSSWEKTVTVFYAASPISKWSSIRLVEPGNGVTGAPKLPQSGEPVKLSGGFEAEWRKGNYDSWGVIALGSEWNESGGRISG